MTDIHPLIEQLATRHGASAVAPDEVERFCASGTRLLIFTEDPLRYREVLDLAVIAPEIARAFPGAFDLGVLHPEVARAVAPQFGVRRWPALVMTRDGGFVGAIEGLRTWEEYLSDIERLLHAPVTRAPVRIAIAQPQVMQGSVA